MHKIVFLNPPLTSYQRYGILGRVLHEMQPNNLCYLAAVTRQAGFETKIIDSPALRLDIRNALEQIKGYSPEYVGVTATSCSVENAGKLATAIKQHNRGIVTILGGVHLSALPENTMQRFKDFDIGVIGEGEKTIVHLLKALAEKSDLRDVKGIIFRKENNFIITSPRETIDDLDILPMPAWDLLPDFSHYAPNLSSFHRFPVVNLVTSRGCNKNCIFCDRPVFGRKVRTHSPTYIMDTIKYLHQHYNIREIVFNDPDFSFSKERTLRLCKMMRDKKIRLSWTCLVRVDSIDQDVLLEMRKAGCWQIGVGIESGSQKILNILSKDTQLDKIEESIHLLDKIGFNIIGYFIIGSPLETENTIKETMAFIKRIKIDNIKVDFFTPYPGSTIYKEIRKFGNFNEDWSKLNGAFPMFIPFNLNEEELWSSAKKILREFYFKPRIVMNFLQRSLDPKIVLEFFKGMIALRRYLIKRGKLKTKPITRENLRI